MSFVPVAGEVAENGGGTARTDSAADAAAGRRPDSDRSVGATGGYDPPAPAPGR